jgi:cytidylate kinase
MPLVIAIDGPAASGKGSLARRLAEHLNLAHLESGLLYRAVARRMLDAGLDPEDATEAARLARAVTLAELANPALREEAAASAASVVSAHPGVRAVLKVLQRDFAAHPPAGIQGVVIDGRDIGTVICPDATVKIYLEASPEIRAERRVRELRQRGGNAISSRVLQDMKDRDARDRDRRASPLMPAEDAFILDTTHLDEDEAFRAALSFIETRNERRPDESGRALDQRRKRD